jgi:hypothetical protein
MSSPIDDLLNDPNSGINQSLRWYDEHITNESDPTQQQMVQERDKIRKCLNRYKTILALVYFPMVSV